MSKVIFGYIELYFTKTYFLECFLVNVDGKFLYFCLDTILDLSRLPLKQVLASFLLLQAVIVTFSFGE